MLFINQSKDINYILFRNIMEKLSAYDPLALTGILKMKKISFLYYLF